MKMIILYGLAMDFANRIVKMSQNYRGIRLVFDRCVCVYIYIYIYKYIHTYIYIYIYKTSLKLALALGKLPRLLPKEIYIFFNVRRQKCKICVGTY